MVLKLDYLDLDALIGSRYKVETLINMFFHEKGCVQIVRWILNGLIDHVCGCCRLQGCKTDLGSLGSESPMAKHMYPILGPGKYSQVLKQAQAKAWAV